jgi:hypothetical protein
MSPGPGNHLGPAFPARQVKPEDHMHANRPSRTRRAIAAVLLTLALLGGGIPAATGANAKPCLVDCNQDLEYPDSHMA